MTTPFADGPVRVRVPATSANLGPGFDALGLALSMYDVVEARADGTGLSIEVSGQGERTATAGEGHLVVRAMREAFGITGGQPPGIALRCDNRIPHGRGLGSSAAAIVAGILAARALAGDGAARLPDDAVLGLATEMEGHPDNVAACLGGGLTIAWTAAGGPRMTRLSPLPGVVPVALVAPEPLATEAARRVLPQSVPHADAAANAGRSALLVAALIDQRPRRAARRDAGSAAPAVPGRGDARDRRSGPAAARGRHPGRRLRRRAVGARLPAENAVTRRNVRPSRPGCCGFKRPRNG